MSEPNGKPSRRGSKLPPRPSTRSETALRAFHEEEEIKKNVDASLLRRLWPFVKPHSRILYGSFTALVLLAGLGMTRPLLMRAGFDAASGDKPGGAAGLYHAGFMLLGVVVLEQALTFVQMFSLQVVGARAMHDLRIEIFRFLHTRRLAFFDAQPVGRLVTRVTNDVDAINEMFASGALNAVGDVLKLVGIVAMMLILNWKLSLLAFAAVPPVGLLVNWVRGRARTALREIRVKTARLNAFLGEQVIGMGITQAYAREKAAQAEFDQINIAYRDANFRSIALDATLDAAVEMVSSTCIAALIWYVGVRPFGAGAVSFGTLVAFIAYVEQFFVPIRDLSARYTLLQSSMTGAERVFLLLENVDEDAPPVETAGAAGDADYAFELDHVTFAYKADAPVLHDVSLHVKTGERVALVGSTGAGKSTVASLALRLYDATNGVVRVLGKDVRAMTRSELRRRFSVVPQDVFLFPGTVAENVAIGASEPDMERVESSLRRVGAWELFQSREGGCAARIDERGSNLSAGERQLLAFARALYRDAPILVLDEATASVDSDTEARLQIALETLMAGRTSIVIAHRLSTIRTADRIVVLAKGKIVEEGSHEQLLASGGVYAKLHEHSKAQGEIGV